jgi:hypothetical protein
VKQFGHIFSRNDEELKEVFGVKNEGGRKSFEFLVLSFELKIKKLK